MALSRPPGRGSVVEWIDSLTEAAVSYLVVADPDLNRQLGATGAHTKRLSVWRSSDPVHGTVGSVIPVVGAEMAHACR